MFLIPTERNHSISNMYSSSAFNEESNKILYRKNLLRSSQTNSVASNGFVSSCDTSVDNDGHSLTYSASSSQAGESTDSSLAYEETEKRLQKEQFQHRREMEMVKAFSATNSPVHSRNSFRTNTEFQSHSKQHHHETPVFHRQSSAASESLNYSEASDAESYLVGQPSDSRHDQRFAYPQNDHTPVPASITRRSWTTPNSTRPKVSSSPSIVSDFSSINSGVSPPPRHAKKISSGEAEVWYQKWWMCGFTDALNFNQP